MTKATAERIDWIKARRVWERLKEVETPIEKYTKYFMKSGVFTPDYLLQRANEASRQIIHRLNRVVEEEGEPTQRALNFVDVDDEGRATQVYLSQDKASMEQLASWANVEKVKHAAHTRKILEVVEFGEGKFGREFTGLLKFDKRELGDSHDT